MKVVCKAVCGLGEASAPKFSHKIRPFCEDSVLALLPKGSTLWKPILQTEILLFAVWFFWFFL